MTTTAIRPLTFPTITRVEARKLVDTRSGAGILAAIAGLSAVLLVWKLTHTGAAELSFENYGTAATQVVAFLAPLLGLLAMTAEWTQRTALTTFVLAPRRLPVLAAKLVAAVVLGLAVLAVGLLLALAATAVGGAVHGGADYGGAVDVLRGSAIFVTLQVVMGAAFGALARWTVVAVTAFLVAPTAWASLSPALLGARAPWFDVFDAYQRLASNHPLDHLPQTLTSVAAWVVLPAVVGCRAALRRDVA